MSRRRIVGSLLVLVVAGASVACSDGSPPASGPAAVSPEVAAAASAMAGRPATVVPTPAGATLRAPLFTVTRPGGGSFVATLISVGGGAVVPVQIDTGSSGLVVDATAVGPTTTRFPGRPATAAYLSSTYTGIAGEASVALGPVATTPVAMTLADVPAGATAFGGTRGILGVGSADGAQVNDSEPAPELALPAPFAAGQTFAAAAEGLGTWTLGPVTAPGGARALPLVPASPAPGGPPPAAGSGQAFAKDVTMCWTVGSRPALCGPTDLDLGATDTAFDTGLDPTLDGGGGKVAPGQPITVTEPQGQPLWSFTTGETASGDQVKVEDLGTGGTRINTGVAFFLGREIAWDYVGGRLLIGAGPPPP